jgi:hypothetical protein
VIELRVARAEENAARVVFVRFAERGIRLEQESFVRIVDGKREAAKDLAANVAMFTLLRNLPSAVSHVLRLPVRPPASSVPSR